MITFINGGVTSNREELLFNSIEKSVNSGNNVIVIIPDQFSFEYDKKLYKRLGAVRFNRITTAGFNRLSELLKNKYGGDSGKENASENAKIILMYKAVKQVRSENKLRYYTRLADKKGLEKGYFISDLIELIQKMRESGIGCETLIAASVESKGILAQKMSDIGEIYKEYMHQLELSGLRDSVSGMSMAVKAASDNNYFSGYDVFIDAFSGFTFDETKMLELCFNDAANVTISLVIDKDSVRNRIHPFRMPMLTFGSLISLAKNKGYCVVEAEETSTYSKEIAYLSKNMLNITKNNYTADCKDIRVLNADDIYSEAAFICAEIKHLVKSGYRYSDIALILHNIQDCSGVFESTLERYDIPYFIDVSDRVSASSIVQYFGAVFNCLITKHYSTENILKLAKSPFFSQNKHNANLLEQYCLKWSIEGDMWGEKYFGLDISLVEDEKARKHIETIEALRERIITPFEKMRSNCGQGEIPANIICEELFTLLESIDISKRTYSVVRSASLNENETQLELSRGLRQLWNSILSAVKSIYDCMQSEKISLRQFYELFRVMLSQMKVSQPPQKLDCITIADASHSRLGNIKATFICQVNDGVFPKTITSTGLLSRVDMSQLQNVLKTVMPQSETGFSGDVKYTLMREELSCYNAVSSATDKLYFTYINADLSGEEKRPSSLIKFVLSCFEGLNDEKVSDISPEFFCTSSKAAFHTVIEHFRDDDPIIASIKMALNSTPYSSKITAATNASQLIKEQKTRPDSAASSERFFKDGTATISASQLDSYYKCPFSYFCRYGLKLYKPEVMDMSANNLGTLVHRALEIVFSLRDDNGEPVFLNNAPESEEKINSIINDCFDDYYKNSLNDDFGKTKRFIIDYREYKNIAVRIVKYVREELAASHYVPVSTEYSFGKDTNKQGITFETKNGRELNLVGSIDRVDRSYKNGSEYIRIIDYKTGPISISYAHLRCGLNLQMLVYLDAYLKQEDKDEKLIPAGVEYMSFGDKVDHYRDSSISEKAFESTEKKNLYKAYKPKGIIDTSKPVKETFGDGKEQLLDYSPYNSNGSKKSVHVSAEELKAIREYACEKVTEFGNALEQGDFPIRTAGHVCDYCDFRGICGREVFDDDMGITKNKTELADSLKSTLDEIIKKQKEGESK